jgi:tripartite-type tricarboxylate transporter receptor subunit TctC
VQPPELDAPPEHHYQPHLLRWLFWSAQAHHETQGATPCGNGTLKALAVTTLNRTAILPEAATLAEQGMPKFEAIGWTALVGPAGLAPETIGTINRIVNEFLSSDEGKQALLNFGMEPLGGTPQDLAGFMASELTKWRPVAERLTPE